MSTSKRITLKYSSMIDEQKLKMISQQNAQSFTRRHLHATATVLEPRKSLTFLRVSPGGCSGVEKLNVGILDFRRPPTFRMLIIALKTTFNNINHLKVITARSA